MLSYFLSKRFLQAFGSQSSPWVRRFSLSALSLSMALLIISQGVLGGVEKLFVKSLQAFNGHLVAMGYGLSQEELAQTIPPKLKKEISSISAFAYTETLLLAKGQVRGLSLKGLDWQSLAPSNNLKFLFKNNNQYIDFKSILKNKKSKLPALILGRDLMAELHLKPGEVLSLFCVEAETKQGGGENFVSFELVGAFETGLKDFDGAFALLALEDLQRLWPGQNLSQGWEMRLQDPERAAFWVDFFERKTTPLFRWMSWQKLNEPILEALRYDRWIFFVVMTLLFLLALATLTGFLALMVLERAPELRLLHALGFSQKRLRALMQQVGFLFSLRALCLGLLMGLGFLYLLRLGAWELAKEVYRIPQLPVEFSASLIIFISVFSFLLSWLVIRFSLWRVFRSWF